MACAVWGTAPAHAAFSITDVFYDSTLPPDWTIRGSGTPASGTGTWTPHVTATPGQTDGWLRLTEASLRQIGRTFRNTPFSPEEGLEIIFDYATYGGTGADYVSFFLIDDSITSSSNYYVSIMLDEFGNGSSPLSNPPGGACVVPCLFKPQSVVARGARSVNRPLLESVRLSTGAFASTLGKVAPVTRADARTVRITVTPVTSAEPYPKVTVEIDPNDGVTGFVKVIDALELTGANNGPVPAAFRLGFEAYSGGATNVHEIRVKSARTLKALPVSVPALGQSALGVLAVLLALLTVPALRSRFRN